MMQQSVLTSKALEDKSSIKEQYCTWANLQGWGERRAKGFDDPGSQNSAWFGLEGNESSSNSSPAMAGTAPPVPHCSGPHGRAAAEQKCEEIRVKRKSLSAFGSSRSHWCLLCVFKCLEKRAGTFKCKCVKVNKYQIPNLAKLHFWCADKLKCNLS